ncbi:MAG: efflux RND transporter permease subunit, partial [Chlamydiae bacterium]|nr:efflux RND transporter permease subunit [Chlamydiota bacterium]
QFPNITPPLIQLTTQYYGANADTIANDVASPLEQQIMGVQDMIYMYSQNSSTGNITLDIFFAIGTDADMAQVNVQNRVEQTLSQLPEAVQKQGITIRKQTPNILLVIALESPDGRYDQTFLSNFASINIVNDLYLLPGISNISIIGQRDYAIRIWLKPDLMAQMGISPSEVVSAVREQNTDFGLGQLGQEPNIHTLPMTVPLSTQGRLSTPEQFANIIIRADNQGSMVLLKDIANVTLGAKDYTVNGEVDGKPALLMAVYQDYGANALDVSEEIHQKMKDLSQYFPAGVQYSIPYDSTIFIHQSITEVFRTMVEAMLLVMFVMFLFLQKWRAALVPVMALIVSIIGTFAGMYAIGYSINTLTLFGMVLAIGIVVDDAIVVVENIERNMHELNLAPKEAALKAMEEVTAPIIAIVCALSAVFIPVAFLGGIAGQLYRQFAITIAISVTISGFVALTLSPAVSAILLKPQKPYKWAEKFNSGFERIRNIYLHWTRKLITHMKISLIFFAVLIGAILFMFLKTPTAFVPDEDQGYLIAIATLPDGASLARTGEIDKQIEEIALKHPGVDYVVSFTGFSLIESLNRTTIGTNFIVLKDWSVRNKKDLSAKAIMQDLNRAYFTLQDAATHVFNPPAIQGLGTVGGFEFWLENRSDDPATLKKAIADFIQ